MINKETRRNIIDEFKIESIYFSGRMTDAEFLSRIYDLEGLPPLNSYYANAYYELKGNENNIESDFDINWIFFDSRFDLLGCEDEIFLEFICLMAHPLVRQDIEDSEKIVRIANDWLVEDGWEIYPDKKISRGSIFRFKQISYKKKLHEDELLGIWEANKLRFFISHRDKHKIQAKKFGEELAPYGISSFVAHDNIESNSIWKDEILKALQTMDACICYLTPDFHESVWTNQEVGYAIAKDVPIYFYSIDGAVHQGFKYDQQAFKKGFLDLVTSLKKDFSKNSSLKKYFIDQLLDARDGSFTNAKNKFVELLGLSFSNEEVELIVKNITSTGGRHERVNKLHAILQDDLEPSHKKIPQLRTFETYQNCLESLILAQHSIKIFQIKKLADWEYELIEKKRK